jgi:hypothetical protein
MEDAELPVYDSDGNDPVMRSSPDELFIIIIEARPGPDSEEVRPTPDRRKGRDPLVQSRFVQGNRNTEHEARDREYGDSSKDRRHWLDRPGRDG